MIAEDRKIVMTKDDGGTLEFEILFTYYSDRFNKNYVVLKTDEENPQLTAMSYEEDAPGTGRAFPIKTDEEWDILEKLIDEYYLQDKK